MPAVMYRGSGSVIVHEKQPPRDFGDNITSTLPMTGSLLNNDRMEYIDLFSTNPKPGF